MSLNRKEILKALKIFFAFFAVLFATGYIHGRMDRKNDDVLFQEILKNCAIVNTSKWYFLKDEQPNYEILIPANAPRYVFHLSSNKMIQLPRDQYSQFVGHKQVLGGRTAELFVGVLGGGALYTVKDAAEYLTKSKKGFTGRVKQIAVAVVASVSGYAFGYWTATHSAFDIGHSREVAEFLSKPENGPRLKRILWLVMHRKCAFSAAQLNSKSTKPNPLHLSLATSVMEAEERVGDLYREVEANDFRALDELSTCVPTILSVIEAVHDGRQADYDYYILQEFIGATQEQKKICVELFQRIDKKFGGDILDEGWSILFRQRKLQTRGNPENLVKFLEEVDRSELE